MNIGDTVKITSYPSNEELPVKVIGKLGRIIDVKPSINAEDKTIYQVRLEGNIQIIAGLDPYFYTEELMKL